MDKGNFTAENAEILKNLSGLRVLCGEKSSFWGRCSLSIIHVIYGIEVVARSRSFLTPPARASVATKQSPVGKIYPFNRRLLR
jgi:hypothetical protein